jgi:soluble lytic murein transglycosylase
MSRRLLGTTISVALLAVLVGVTVSEVNRTVSGLALPLSDEGVIREQAAEKHLDPALIAAVIDAETKFEPRQSSAGAEGLMQILPATAYFLAHLSGGSRFTESDLATPRINVAYGSYYLRYLLNHYGGNEMLAVAAYNAGLANVDSWVAEANAAGRQLTVAAIPFPETRAYVERVLQAQREYRAQYPRQLGLE